MRKQGKSTDNSHKAATQRHDSHSTRNALKENILDGRERKSEMFGKKLEDSKAHKAGRHRHDRHPPRLEAKVDVGSTDDGAYC